MCAGWRVIDDLPEVVVAELAALELEAAFPIAYFPAPRTAVAEGFFGVVLIMTPQCFFSPLGVDGVEVGIIREIRAGNDGQFGEGVVQEATDGLVRCSIDIEIFPSQLAVNFIEGLVENEVDQGGNSLRLPAPGDRDDFSDHYPSSSFGVFNVVGTVRTG